MKKIKLSQNKYALVDDADFDLISRYKWYFNNGYAVTYHQGKRIRMHRLILNTPEGKNTDHRDRDKLNNRKSNLRVCTTRQNNRNITIRKDNISGYIGVSLDKTTNRWRPLIYVNGKAKTCGQFQKLRHAALARDLWATFFHQDFAATNFTVVS